MAVDLEPRVFGVLRHLVAASGRTVSKDDLVAAVWEGRFVRDAAVARAVQKARRVLESDDRAPARLIETVHGRGYRVTAAVDTVETSPAAEPAPRPARATTVEPPPASTLTRA
jgi:DNA-binding winged helix-turn-helix (wHTH) protein